MSGLLIGLIIGGVGLVLAVIWAVIDNLFIYKRKDSTPDNDENRTDS